MYCKLINMPAALFSPLPDTDKTFSGAGFFSMSVIKNGIGEP